MRTVQINNNKHITLANYLKAWKILKSIPKDKIDVIEIKESLTTWYPVTARECLKQYTDAVHDRINGRMYGKYKPVDIL